MLTRPPPDPPAFETLENVAIQPPSDNRPVTCFFHNGSLRFVRADRIWEVEYGPETLTYQMIRQATLAGIETATKATNQFIKAYKARLAEDDRRDVG